MLPSQLGVIALTNLELDCIGNRNYNHQAQQYNSLEKSHIGLADGCLFSHQSDDVYASAEIELALL